MKNTSAVERLWLKATFGLCLVQIPAQSRNSFVHVAQTFCIWVLAIPYAAASLSYKLLLVAWLLHASTCGPVAHILM